MNRRVCPNTLIPCLSLGSTSYYMYDVRSASPEKCEAVWDYGIHTARDLEGTIEVGHLLSDANDAQSGEAYANVVR
jgi:hypothetical protein